MPSTADRLDFGPPRDAGSARAFMLALLVHALLIAALTWGINWKRSDRTVSFEAELWSSVPREAAPKLIEAPPPPPPPPQAPVIKVAPPPLPEVDIALEQEKKRKLLQQQKDAEAQAALKARQAAEKLKAELQAKKEKEHEQKAQEELARRKAAEEARKAQARELEKQKLAEAAAAEKQRQAVLKRMMGLAGASGGENAKGSAQKSSGPSASYGGRVRAAVRPNVVFTDAVIGNPTAEIEVRTTLDGTIISQRLVKSSGNKAWDEAVIKAVIRTGSLPRDIDGRVPTPMILEMRPKD